MEASALAQLPDEALECVLLAAVRADPSAFARVAACSRQWLRVSGLAREACCACVVQRLAPEVHEAVVSEEGRALARALGGTAAESWADVEGRTWLERLRALHSERWLLARTGTDLLWRDVHVRWAHQLRVVVARLLLDPRTALLADPFGTVLARVRAHVAVLIDGRAASDRLRTQLMHRRPADAVAAETDLALPLTLEIAECGRLPRLPAVAAFLRAAVARHDVERAYVALLTVQRSLLADGEVDTLEREFSATFQGLEPVH
jgi:hypothetical protein